MVTSAIALLLCLLFHFTISQHDPVSLFHSAQNQIIVQLVFRVCVLLFAVIRKIELNRINKLWQLVPSGSGLEDIKLAIQQLTMQSHTSTSTYSSLSGSESGEPVMRRLMRHSSLETINTNVTSTDEFVWVDSHNRYVTYVHSSLSVYNSIKNMSWKFLTCKIKDSFWLLCAILQKLVGVWKENTYFLIPAWMSNNYISVSLFSSGL